MFAFMLRLLAGINEFRCYAIQPAKSRAGKNADTGPVIASIYVSDFATTPDLIPSVSYRAPEVASRCPSGYYQLMSSPFRYNKKRRKYYRKKAKDFALAADTLAEKGVDPQIVAAIRKIADIDRKLSLAKRRKKKPTRPK
jgi:hypothetical protein